jgi:hypothetical protein
MEKKISDVNEMIEHNRHDEQVDEDEDMMKGDTGCASNRSSPTMADKEKHHNDNNDDAHDDEHDDASEKRDNGDRCSSSNVKSSNSTRTMADELAVKEKEVSL